MMKCVVQVIGLSIAMVIIGSCGVDDSVGISSDRRQEYVASAEDMPQNSDTSKCPLGFVFYIDADGTILSSMPLFSMKPIMGALTVYDASKFEDGEIIEIQDSNAIEMVFVSTGGSSTGMSPSSIDIIGLMTYNECLYSCCGGTDCDWGTLKYCISKCMEDHDPKQD